MYLTFERHHIIAQEGVSLPYAATGLYDLCAWRDKHVDFSSRIITKLALIGLILVALVETVVRFPLALIGLLFSQGKWSKGFCYSILTTAYGFYGLLINLFSKKLSAPIINLDLKLRSFFLNQLLFEACQSGRRDLVKQILNKGADPHQIYLHGISAALIPRLLGYPQLNDLLPLNAFENKYLEVKRLSHWLSLKGKFQVESYKSINLEGCQPRVMFDVVLKSFKKFFECNSQSLSLSKEKALKLEQALEFAYLEHSYEKIAERIRKGNLTFLGTGWDMHRICLCFSGDYIGIGNEGERPLGASTLKVCKINRSKVTPQLIEEIMTYEFLSSHKGKDYFYRTLIEKLEGKTDDVSSAFEQIAPKAQTNGMCALSAKKAALRFAWAMLLYHQPNHATLQQAEFESKLFTDWSAVNNYYSDPSIQSIHPDALEKVKKKDNRFWNNINSMLVF